VAPRLEERHSLRRHRPVEQRQVAASGDDDVHAHAPQRRDLQRAQQRLGALLDAKIAASSAVSLATLRARPLPVRFRDGLTRLLSPYL
jgi:hypothetical protein